MTTNPLLLSLGSYFTPKDGYRHVIVATSDGEVHEIFYNPQKGVGNAKLACFCGLRFLTAFYTPDDDFQHPIAATDTNDIFEMFYKPGDFHVTGSLANFPGMIAMSGFYAADDHMRILIVGTGDGAIHEVFYHPSIGVHISQPALATFPGLTHIAAFYSSDDKFRHVIVATNDGNIAEVWYHPTVGVHITNPPLANFKNIVSLAAFYAEDDHMRIVIAATKDGAIHEIFYHPNIGVHISQPALATFPNIAGISAFNTSDDHFRHVIVTDTSGSVAEVFYHPSIGVHISSPSLAHFGPPSRQVEYAGPDLNSLDPATAANVANSSPAGRCVALGGNANRLYTFSHTGGIWQSVSQGSWALQQGSPVPAEISGVSVYVLAVSVNSDMHAFAANESGLWETTNGGASWLKVLDPQAIGAASSTATAVALDDADRVFVGVTGGVAVRTSANVPFQFTNLGDDITAVVISDNKVWARSASALFVSTTHGATWLSPIPIPNNITFMIKERETLAATDDFAYLVALKTGTYDPIKNPGGCSGDNVLVIFDAKKGLWTQQDVLSTDKVAWLQAMGVAPTDGHTCNGTGSDVSADGRRFIKCIRLRDAALSNVVGQRIQLIYGAGQEIWRARSQNADGTITDWNWAVGTTGRGFTNRDPVHADIWDFHLDPSVGGRTAWLAGDGGVFVTTVGAANYEFSNVTWQPAMPGLHTHQIQSLTLLRVNPVDRPRLAYVLGDNSAFFRDTSPIVMPQATWQSYSGLGDGSWSGGDSSAPSFVLIVRQLTVEAFLRYGVAPRSVWLINPKQSAFIDPSSPTRFRFLPSPWQEGQFGSADVVMMVDLPLTFQSSNMDVPFPTQPGPSSNGAPVLIRNRTFDVNPDINGANAKGKGWTLERGTLPAGVQGFAVSGDRAHPEYYIFDGASLFAERNGQWTPIVTNLVSTQAFGPVFPNPYDDRVIYVLTSDKGIQVSTNSAVSFQPEANLNALLGPDVTDINQIAFNYDRPSCVVVGTETGKLFFSPGGGVWRDFTRLLPRPVVPIRSVAIDCEAIYLATLGRGLWRVVHYGGA